MVDVWVVVLVVCVYSVAFAVVLSALCVRVVREVSDLTERVAGLVGFPGPVGEPLPDPDPERNAPDGPDPDGNADGTDLEDALGDLGVPMQTLMEGINPHLWVHGFPTNLPDDAQPTANARPRRPGDGED